MKIVDAPVSAPPAPAYPKRGQCTHCQAHFEYEKADLRWKVKEHYDWSRSASFFVRCGQCQEMTWLGYNGGDDQAHGGNFELTPAQARDQRLHVPAEMDGDYVNACYKACSHEVPENAVYCPSCGSLCGATKRSTRDELAASETKYRQRA